MLFSFKQLFYIELTLITEPYEYVDLGLSVLWATCNVGADSPEEYGKYYAWEETAGCGEKMFGDGANNGIYYNPGTVKQNYSYNYYKWGKANLQLGKYVTAINYGMTPPDYLAVLLRDDDAATANLGSPWRMPTTEELQELKSGCDYEWCSDYNGKAGYKFMKKGDHNTFIFLPAVGFWQNAAFSQGGIAGYYWSSSVKSKQCLVAFSFSFTSAVVYDHGYDFARYLGFAVRPVRPKN